MFEFGVRLCDRIRANNQILCQSANARQLIAILQCASFGGVPNLLHQL